MPTEIIFVSHNSISRFRISPIIQWVTAGLLKLGIRINIWKLHWIATSNDVMKQWTAGKQLYTVQPNSQRWGDFLKEYPLHSRRRAGMETFQRAPGSVHSDSCNEPKTSFIWVHFWRVLETYQFEGLFFLIHIHSLAGSLSVIFFGEKIKILKPFKTGMFLV